MSPCFHQTLMADMHTGGLGGPGVQADAREEPGVATCRRAPTAQMVLVGGPPELWFSSSPAVLPSDQREDVGGCGQLLGPGGCCEGKRV